MTEPSEQLRTHPRRMRRRRAFTLVESTMAVLIVSGVLVAALGTFGAIGQARQSQVDRAEAFALAEQVMAEVLQCYFQEPSGAATIGPDAGETMRSAFDDVDDYDGWSASPPRARDGTAMSGYAGWAVRVRVEHARLDRPDQNNSSPSGLKLITVSVTTRRGAEHELTALRASGGAYEQAPASPTNYLTYGGVAVKVSEKGRTVFGGAHPLNVTTGQ